VTSRQVRADHPNWWRPIDGVSMSITNSCTTRRPAEVTQVFNGLSPELCSWQISDSVMGGSMAMAGPLWRTRQGGRALADAAQLRSRGHAPTAGDEGGIQDALRERRRQRREGVLVCLGSIAGAVRLACCRQRATRSAQNYRSRLQLVSDYGEMRTSLVCHGWVSAGTPRAARDGRTLRATVRQGRKAIGMSSRRPVPGPLPATRQTSV